CTASAFSCWQMPSITGFFSSRSPTASLTLISSWSFRARSISASTDSERPLPATVTTGFSLWPRERRYFLRSLVSAMVYLPGEGGHCTGLGARWLVLLAWGRSQCWWHPPVNWQLRVNCRLCRPLLWGRVAETSMARSKSSSRWLQEHEKDHYVQLARKEGYRSRASYKLLELDAKDRLFRPGMVVVDLGAAPGGWSQIAAQRVGHHGRVIASDILA